MRAVQPDPDQALFAERAGADLAGAQARGCLRAPLRGVMAGGCGYRQRQMRYCRDMAGVKKLDLDDPAPVLDDDDEETLAAIDEGIRDAETGRTIPIEDVRKLLPQWITIASSSRKER